MKPEQNAGFGKHREGKGLPRPTQAAQPRQPREKADERREALVLLAIAFLFVANVVLYLCHHYGLTSLNDWRPRSEMSARVITD